MINEMQLIADRIKTKLQDKYASAVSEIGKYVNIPQGSKNENVHFLLKMACEFNLLKETHDLLELNVFNDIDQPLQFENKVTARHTDNGKTLLGLASFNGHIEIVKYLVEVRLANVNAKDVHGDTPLHQVVYGDSYPFHHASYGTSHDEVAKYLLLYGGDLSIKNDKPCDLILMSSPPQKIDLDKLPMNSISAYIRYNDELIYVDKSGGNYNELKISKRCLEIFDQEMEVNTLNKNLPRTLSKEQLNKITQIITVHSRNENTAYERTKWCAPLNIENMVGRRFITNTGSAFYYADKVRPIFEKELARAGVIRVVRERPEAFDKFCLEHAIAVYVKDKKVAFGYSSMEELYHALDALSEKEWKHMRMVVSSQKPAPFSWKMGLIFDQLPKMGKQSAAIGAMVALLTYYESQSILLSVTTGSLSAVLAWSYLTEAGYKQKINERLGREQRVQELRQHDRFFKAPPVFHIQQLEEAHHMDDNLVREKEMSY
jgi:ankyrin repeat protein